VGWIAKWDRMGDNSWMDMTVGFPWSLVYSDAEGKTKGIGMSIICETRDIRCRDLVYLRYINEREGVIFAPFFFSFV
jgi:hypothetical protein